MNFTDRRRNTHPDIVSTESDLQSAKNEYKSFKAKNDKSQRTL